MNTKNRGMFLESIINKTIQLYKLNGIGIFHKKSVPITFSGVKGTNEIKRGWLSSKSTVDYYGIYQGYFVSFEAKSTNEKSLPLSNIKDHQLDYINQIKAHGGVAFFIVAFSSFDKYFIVEPSVFNKLNKKSLSIELAKKECIELELIYPGILDFAPYIKRIK